MSTKPKAQPTTNSGGVTTPPCGKARAREDGRGTYLHPAQGLSEKACPALAHGEEVLSSKDKGFIILADPTIDIGQVLPANIAKNTKP